MLEPLLQTRVASRQSDVSSSRPGRRRALAARWPVRPVWPVWPVWPAWRAWPAWPAALVAVGALAIACDEREARADDIPIVTLTDSGPDAEIPTNRSFYVAGDASDTSEFVQVVVVRRGSASMFGDDGPSCHDLLADLSIDAVTSTAADDDGGAGDGGDGADLGEDPMLQPRYDAGVHRAFEIFPHATGSARRSHVMVTTAWQRPSASTKQFRVLVPHDREFFSPGYGYCLMAVTTAHAQVVSDEAIEDLVDELASKIVACGDSTKCDDDALVEYQSKVETAIARSHRGEGVMVGGGSVEQVRALAARLREAAKAELGGTTGIVEALDHMNDRFVDKSNVMTPVQSAVWAEIGSDPFAAAVAIMLARSGALLPQVKTGAAAKKGTDAGAPVALFTADGRLEVKAVQLLDDGRGLRVASSVSPKGEGQARVLASGTDSLVVADGLTLEDLVQLGERHVRIDHEWVTLRSLGDRVSSIGQESWNAEDAAYLAAATAQMRRLADFVDLTTTGATCARHTYTAAENELTNDAVRKHLGEWLQCQKADSAALESMLEQLELLASEEQAWKQTKERLVGRSRRIATLTTTAPENLRVSFRAKSWVFSYVTPIVGYAGVLRPDETFGLFYLGAQIHLYPNPVDDVQWRRGVTAKDLRRALALELGIAPYQSSVGPDMRYGGPGSLPPLFLGAAVHILPYTSLTFGAAFVDRRNSTLPQEEPHTVVTPYMGFTVQLNLPDLIRQASGTTSDTETSR